MNIDQVLCIVQVIGGVVDAKDLVLVYVISDKCNCVLLFIGKHVLFSVIWDIVIMWQQMVLEPWDEVLVFVSYALWLWDELTSMQGLSLCLYTYAKISWQEHCNSLMWWWSLAGMKGRASFCDSCDWGLTWNLDLDLHLNLDLPVDFDLCVDLDFDLDLDLGFSLDGSLDVMEWITSSCLWWFAIWAMVLFLFVFW